MVLNWMLYRDFQFEDKSSDLQDSEMNKVREIARYTMDNPSLMIGIDSSMDPSGNEKHNQELCDRRARTVRDALIEAGLPESRILKGSLRDPQLERRGELAVFIRTRR